MIFKGDIYFNRTFLNQNSNQSVLLFPSLFQEYIAKQFEIRVFYFDGLIFATAILSAQETKSEMIDYRSFDGKNEAIKVPYRLANNLKNMVLKLTKRLGYRTCSIDFILSKDGEAYFLEVNPVGQFGMVSTICNYQIEKKIAIKLINYEKK
jgi:glutathione synthase/RimK-type ligase-like ATP-grasp enzyme